MRAPILLAALVLAACARSEAPADAVRADSAGVQIVTSGARDSVLPWRFEELGVLRDSLGEPYLFDRVFASSVLTDRAGRTYVLTRDPSIVRFGREGQQEMTFGRRGSGPGELQFPTGIGSMGDTVWVADAAKRALVRYGPDFEPVDDRRLDDALAGADLILFRTGGVWFRRVRYDSLGITSEVIGDTLSGAPLARTFTPAGKPVRFACGVGLSNGMTILAPQVTFHGARARIVLNAQPGYALQLFEGPRLVASVRRPLAPHAPSPDDVRLMYPEGMTIGLGPGRPPCVVPIPELMEKLGVAEAMPLVFDVMLLKDGSMWALRTPHQAPPLVDVFGPDGVYRGTLRDRRLPVAELPNGELLFAREDTASGGTVLARVRIVP